MFFINLFDCWTKLSKPVNIPQRVIFLCLIRPSYPDKYMGNKVKKTTIECGGSQSN